MKRGDCKTSTTFNTQPCGRGEALGGAWETSGRMATKVMGCGTNAAKSPLEGEQLGSGRTAQLQRGPNTGWCGGSRLPDPGSWHTPGVGDARERRELADVVARRPLGITRVKVGVV